ncbi:MAG: AhpC/TSA family protein [Bacteroidales bacterium]|nr:AhpC/TSA family protein [Bacteroidales bacterium]
MNLKLLSFVALGVALASCQPKTSDQQYNVTLDVMEQLNGITAFMVNFDTGEKIDSAVIENGKCEFSGTVAEPLMVRMVADGNRLGSFVLEGGDITVSDRVAKGTPLNEENNKIMEAVNGFNKMYYNTPDGPDGDVLRKQISDLYDHYSDSVMLANLDNPVGFTFFLDKAYAMDLAQLNEILAKHPSLKKYQRVNKLIAAAENMEKTSAGKKFADFTVTNDSVSQSLSDYVGKGKPVLVDFWASWCGPCIRETAVLKQLLAEFGDKGLEVLGVAVWDEPDNTVRAIADHQLPWPQIINAQSVPTDIYGISAIPCILLIGPDGTILSRGKQGEELIADVTTYFSAPQTSAAE